MTGPYRTISFPLAFFKISCCFSGLSKAISGRPGYLFIEGGIPVGFSSVLTGDLDTSSCIFEIGHRSLFGLICLLAGGVRRWCCWRWWWQGFARFEWFGLVCFRML